MGAGEEPAGESWPLSAIFSCGLEHREPWLHCLAHTSHPVYLETQLHLALRSTLV